MSKGDVKMAKGNGQGQRHVSQTNVTENGRKCPQQTVKMSATQSLCPQLVGAIKELKDLGIIERVGGNFGGEWRIVKKDKK